MTAAPDAPEPGESPPGNPDAARQQTAAGGEDASLGAVLADVRSLWSESAAQARGVGELALLELDLAVTSLRRMFWATLVLAGLALSTWLCLLAVIVAVIAALDVPLPAALLVGVVINGAAGIGLVVFIRSLARDVQFRALRTYLSEQNREQPTEPTQQAA